MKKIIYGSILCIASLAACNSNSTQNKTTDTNATQDSATLKPDTAATAAAPTQTGMAPDTGFAMAAADGGMLEVKVSELAKKSGTTSGVKNVADMMVTDHTKANDELKAIAAKNNISLPTALSAESQKKYDMLAAKKGNDFDKAYMDQMLADHQATIDKFQAEANNGTNADLKTFATNTLPTLHHHLDMVTTTKKGMK